MLSRNGASGFTLIELAIGMAVLAILVMVGLPNLTAWIQNTQIRTAAEGIQSGLQLARSEALRRNTSVRFQLVNSLTGSCALSTTGTNHVVSLADPTGACNSTPSDAGPILQVRAGTEGSPNAAVSASASSMTFNGLGRPLPSGSTLTINITNPTGGACKTAAGSEPMRCLRVTVSTGGQVRMCDPAVDDNTDPRFC